MNLIELIPYLKSEKKFVEFLESRFPAIETHQLDIYMKGSLSPNSELIFLDAEELDGKIVQNINGIEFINLFPVFHLLEIFEGYYENDISDKSMAIKIINYRLNDSIPE